MENEHGVDVSYFVKELKRLTASVGDRPKDDLARYLRRLADIVEPDTRLANLERLAGEMTWALEYDKGDKGWPDIPPTKQDELLDDIKALADAIKEKP